VFEMHFIFSRAWYIPQEEKAKDSPTSRMMTTGLGFIIFVV